MTPRLRIKSVDVTNTLKDSMTAAMRETHLFKPQGWRDAFSPMGRMINANTVREYVSEGYINRRLNLTEAILQGFR